MMALAGGLSDAETLTVLKDLMNRFGSENTAVEQNSPANADLRCVTCILWLLCTVL